jgi:multiple antibiotic resistance protein
MFLSKGIIMDMQVFLKVFIPLFVAIDVFLVLPIFTSFTQEVSTFEKKSIINKAIITSLCFGPFFIIFGEKLFHFFGITRFDFQIGGGILLFVIGIGDLVLGGFESRRKSTTEFGIVPLAIPLILGPASLTTLMILSSEYGKGLALISLFLNILIIWFSLSFSKAIMNFLSVGFSQAIAKIMSLFLLAISVMMIRSGIIGVINM